MPEVQVIGLTTTMFLNDGASSAYVALSQPVQITLNEGEVSDYPTFYLGQTGSVKTRAPGMIEPGSWDVTSFYNYADWARLNAVQGVVKNWKVVLPDTGAGGGPHNIVVAGFLSKLPEFELEPDKRVDFKFVIKHTGLPTVT